MMNCFNQCMRILVLNLAILGLCRAFMPRTTVSLNNNPLSTRDGVLQPTTTSVFLAKKRRRRKQDDEQSASSSAPAPESLSGGTTDDLPDFELEEERVAPVKRAIVSNPDEITPAMMGSPGKQPRSVSDLIKDRSLESKFEFDEAGDDALPDLAELARQRLSSDVQPPGQLRKTKKYGVSETKEEESNPLKNIPFITDSKGNINFVKVLESGAWLGIFLLIAWEVYINSPLFERAAPMAPVVYNLYM